MADADRLAAALRYQQELEEAQRPAFGNPNLMRQGQRMNLPARQAPGPVQDFATQAMSLDPQPDQGYGTMAAEMALGFVPGVGQAMALRDIERGRRANDPVTMGLGAASLIPVGKLISALRGRKQMGPVSELDVYQGSPHKFPPTERNPLGEFDPTKIGTGEGNQAYSYGHYLAENPGVAGEYVRMSPELNALYDQRGSLRAARKVVPQELDMAIQKAESTNKGYLYNVDLPDEQIAKMLDWDKPLSQQRAEIQKFAREADISGAIGKTKGVLKAWREGRNVGIEATGRDLHNALSYYGQQDSPAVAEALRKAGIPGIKYLDEGSRVGGKGTRNFVVFPGGEKMLNILERQGMGVRSTAKDLPILYHGSYETRKKTIPDPGRAVETKGASFLSTSEDVAQTFTLPREYGEQVFFNEAGRELRPGKVTALKADVKNPKTLTGPDAQKFIDDTTYQGQVIEAAKKAGHDSVIAKDVLEGIGERYKNDVWAVFNQAQMSFAKRKK